MIVVLDTQVLYGDHFLATATSLADELDSRKSCLMIPEVVMDELEYQFKDQLANLNKSIGEINRTLGRFKPFASAVPVLDPEDCSKSRKKMINGALSDHGISIQPYPNMKVLVERGRQFRKPFFKTKRDKNEVEAGYRDAAIWQSVVDIAIKNPDETIVFVSGNTNDFAEEDKITLHSDLTTHISSLNIDQSRIIYLVGLSELENNYFYNTTIAFDSLEDAISHHPKPFQNFEANLLAALQDQQLLRSLDAAGITEENEIQNISGIVDISCEKTWGKFADDSSSVKFTVELEADATVTGYTSLEEFQGNEEIFVESEILNTNRYQFEPLVWTKFTTSLGVLLNIVFNNKTKTSTYTISKIVRVQTGLKPYR